MTERLSDADLCRQRGWDVGDWLWGAEGVSSVTIRLTAIGESMILARAVERDNEPVEAPEGHWTLGCREWVRVPSD